MNPPLLPSGKSLFSLHYLESRLPAHPEWAEDPTQAFAALAALWEKAQRYGAAWNEAQTEDEFIKPMLALLGWSYIPQVKNSRGGRVNRPDYALFADEATKNAAYPHQGDDDPFYGRSLAIAEAKYWGRPLSRKDASGRDTWKSDNNPSHQMVGYLVGTRCPWGILTNGRIWRLYSREVSSTASEYYEVDLAAICLPLSSQERGPGGEVDTFRRFWLFFRRAAFTPDAQGRSFVRRIHAGSATYAREISDKLKELVFDEVMPEIAGGFVAYRRQQLGMREETAESLGQVYRASLSLLYKLLFVLYAEARNLLPITNPAYWEESLTRMARQVAERADRGLAISDATHATRQYDSLLALFRRIDQGDPDLGVPRYDGGLFNPATPDNRFLAGHKLSDRAVARAVDILVRDAGQPVDYAYISVRNLGSIYEGLLENKLALTSPPAPSPLPITGEERGLGGEVLLVNDRGERKATGSYYTPDYIVDYIVRQTLGPVLDGRQTAFAAAMDRIAELRGRLAKTLDAGANRQLRGQLAGAERDAAEAFLGIKVCDPAMGSGHFLVNAVDFLTDGIILRMQAYHDSHAGVPWEWNPIRQTVERVRGEIVGEMARQGIGLDAARLDDTSLLTRLVLKRCIYGVDLNPMAVELAKLSLWLHSFTVGAPLSFLDHHLRWGNSLIGSDVRTVEAAIVATDSGQMALWGGPFAGLLALTTTMLEIAGRADTTLADVRQSADEFAAMQAALTPYKQALDLWVSQWFDEGRKTKDHGAAFEFMTVHGADVLPALRGERALAEKVRVAVERSRALWAEKRFFHWDLEFPEVFVDLARRDWAENPGFDAVIGNPPYVR
ncbi:MAG: restriction endonuclease, partial [Anaerolineae bacterium]|nr:restriction endonuclease [Anaerolineae bacterium]